MFGFKYIFLALLLTAVWYAGKNNFTAAKFINFSVEHISRIIEDTAQEVDKKEKVKEKPNEKL